MSDSYVEVLVKRRGKSIHTVIKVVMMVITVAMLAAGYFLHWILFIPGIFLMFVDSKFLPRLSVEYEYLYVAGELTIDKILGKEKRKNCFVEEVKQMEIIAPVDSDKLREFDNKQCVIKDFSSEKEEAKVYACIFRKNQELWKVLFEPNEKLLEAMWTIAPQKVIRN